MRHTYGSVTVNEECSVDTTRNAIEAIGLHKRYGHNVALDDFCLTVPEGSVYGLLGPNGAGKTTALRILTTLLHPDEGRAEVGGHDVLREPTHVRYRIGLTGQYSTVDDKLTGQENLEMFGRLYHLSAPVARRRAGELLEQFGLTEAADKPPKQYSGGMRRRLDLATSFIMAPPVLFLDEPTTGLDPAHRVSVWQQVRDLVARGTTVLLTTHYLDEADQLADAIAVIDRGTVQTVATPDQLKARIGGRRIEITLVEPLHLDRAAEVMTRLLDVEVDVHVMTGRLSAPLHDSPGALTRAVRALDEAGLQAEDVTVRRPTLDEVFVRLTGDSPSTRAMSDRTEAS